MQEIDINWYVNAHENPTEKNVNGLENPSEKNILWVPLPSIEA